MKSFWVRYRKVLLLSAFILLASIVAWVVYVNLRPAPTIGELEASGDVPKLDRSADIVGPDADGNGIRDDVDSYIEIKVAKNGWTPSQKKSLQKMASVFQEMLVVDTNNRKATDEVSGKDGMAIACFGNQFGYSYQGISTEDIQEITVNTKPRILAYIEYNRSRSGTVSSQPRAIECNLE